MIYRLINARPSPYGRKVAVALREKGLTYEVQYDEPWGGSSCTPDHSPLQQLPILIAPDGETVYDSTFILEWLEITHPEPALLPADRGERLAALKLKMLGERLMEIAQSLIFELHRPAPSETWIDRQTKKIIGGLAEIERLLPDAAPDSDRPLDLGRIAVATTLLLWEFVVADGLSPDVAEFRWRGRYPRITGMIAALEQRPSFAATQPASMPVDITGTVG